MKYLVRKSYIDVIGVHWGAYLQRGSLAPISEATAAYRYPLSGYDIDQIGGDKITRDDVQAWLDAHAGDFPKVIDFSASIELPNGETLDIPWEQEESEFFYNDCMFGQEE